MKAIEEWKICKRVNMQPIRKRSTGQLELLICGELIDCWNLDKVSLSTKNGSFTLWK